VHLHAVAIRQAQGAVDLQAPDADQPARLRRRRRAAPARARGPPAPPRTGVGQHLGAAGLVGAQLLLRRRVGHDRDHRHRPRGQRAEGEQRPAAARRRGRPRVGAAARWEGGDDRHRCTQLRLSTAASNDDTTTSSYPASRKARVSAGASCGPASSISTAGAGARSGSGEASGGIMGGRRSPGSEVSSSRTTARKGAPRRADGSNDRAHVARRRGRGAAYTVATAPRSRARSGTKRAQWAPVCSAACESVACRRTSRPTGVCDQAGAVAAGLRRRDRVGAASPNSACWRVSSSASGATTIRGRWRRAGSRAARSGSAGRRPSRGD
jgi:hypothetical protein